MDESRPREPWYPERYVINHDVVNFITCPHKRNQRCYCADGGVPPRKPEAASPAPAAPPKPPAPRAPKPGEMPEDCHLTTIGEVKRHLYPLWGAVVAVLHRFPDAFQAVTSAITEYTRLHPEPIGVVFR